MKLRKKQVIETTDEDVKVIYSQYSSFRYKKIVSMVGLVVILVVSALYGMTVGSYPITMGEVYQVIVDHLFDLWSPLETIDQRVVWEQRMPRLLTAVVAGAGLAVAGASMQSMMKNPLADPYTTGISSGASFGAVVAITLGISIGSLQAGTVLFAFVFSLIPAAVIVLLSKFKRATAAMMILAGISVMYIFNAMTQYMMIVADNETMAAAYEWTVGTLNKSSWSALPIMASIVGIGSIILVFLSRFLNAMNSGDNYAKTVGINVERMRIVILVVISIVSASVVSFTGIIGFVGLVAPHVTRIFLGSDNRHLIPGSLLMGATMLVLCDILAKSFTNTALPIGIVTAFVGGPVFLLLIIRQKKEVW
ncbi:MAG: iron ABC transporter permease [Candidatus Methanomethylophilaceae archaeon]|nr:iron ABC transporter permease [Candidatus Methanomethylophilaceae archaeon]